jgi:hypothetical protein
MQITASLPAFRLPPWIARLGRSRIVLGSAALGVLAAGAAWQWSWLVAIGVAPLLLSVAPCAAMCGLGLCMHRMGGRACASAPQDGTTSTTQET